MIELYDRLDAFTDLQEDFSESPLVLAVASNSKKWIRSDTECSCENHCYDNPCWFDCKKYEKDGPVCDPHYCPSY